MTFKSDSNLNLDIQIDTKRAKLDSNRFKRFKLDSKRLKNGSKTLKLDSK